MKQILQSYKTGELWLADVPAPLCGKRGVVVRTCASFVSAGTERMLVDFARKSLVGKALQMPDQVRKVIRKMKTDGIIATLEKVESKLDKPIPLGYSAAGVVVEAGPQADGFAVGDRVACGGAGYANHAEYDYVPRNLVVHLPDNVSFEDASAATVGSIAMQGVRQCDLRLGETVAVVGLGLMGVMAVQMCKASGCRVIGFDPNPSRCALAKALGADAAVSANLEGEARAFSGGRGVDAVLITAATHSNEPVTVAAEICRAKGRVVATGLVGMNLPRDQYYKKEIDFRLSCSYGPGRYDPVYEEQGIDYPFGYVRWTEQRNMEAVIALISEGKLTPSKFITHRFAFDDSLDAYKLLLGEVREPYLGIVLSYGNQGDDAKPADIVRRVDITKNVREPKTGDVGVGFIGCGNFASSVILPNLRKVGGHVLRGVCTARGMSAGETARKEGFAFATTDEKDILSDAASDLVFVTTRHDLHASQVQAALAAGKYVFTEKPLCIAEEDLDAISSTTGAAEGRIMVGFNRRFSPHARLLREYFSKRTTPLVMQYSVNAGPIPLDSWIQDPTVGGGRMIGEGCHFIDFMAYVAGSRIVDVQARCVRSGDASSCDADSVSVNLVFADGSIGNLLYFALGDTSLPKERCVIHGAGSTAVMDNFMKTTCSGALGRRSLSGKQEKGFREEIAATLAAVATGGPSPIPFDDIADATRATFAVVKALKG